MMRSHNTHTHTHTHTHTFGNQGALVGNKTHRHDEHGNERSLCCDAGPSTACAGCSSGGGAFLLCRLQAFLLLVVVVRLRPHCCTDTNMQRQHTRKSL